MQQITRVKENKIIAGVCTGLSKYFLIDVWVVRALFMVLFFSFVLPGVITYLILWAVIPGE